MKAFKLLQNNMTVTELRRAAQITQRTSSEYVIQFEREKWITTVKDGRCKRITLTTQGAVLLAVIITLENTMDGSLSW